MFKNIIDTRICNILQESSKKPTADSVIFTADNVKETIQSLKTKKACGKDGVYNEHLLHGGNTLYVELSVLFKDTFMYNKYMEGSGSATIK